MGLLAVGGAKIFIGPAYTVTATDLTLAEAQAVAEVDWVEVDGWNQMGSYGDTATIITTTMINRGRDIKQKGTRNAGSMTNRFADFSTDVGQQAWLAAEATTLDYMVRIVFDDSLGTNGTTDYMAGLVSGWSNVGGDGNTVVIRESMLEINSPILRVEAA